MNIAYFPRYVNMILAFSLFIRQFYSKKISFKQKVPFAERNFYINIYIKI